MAQRKSKVKKEEPTIVKEEEDTKAIAAAADEDSDSDDDNGERELSSYEKQQQMKAKAEAEAAANGGNGDGEEPAFDKGGHISEETTAYFRTVLDLLEANEFESPDDLQLLVSSAWRETKGREYRITVNSNGSQMLQKMVAAATSKQLRRFMHRIDKMYYAFLTDRNASHVIQSIVRRLPTLLQAEYNRAQLAAQPPSLESAPKPLSSMTRKEKRAARRMDKTKKEEIKAKIATKPEAAVTAALTGNGGTLAEEADDDDNEDDDASLPSLTILVQRMCHELSGDWKDLIWDPQASHICRDLLAMYAGHIDLAAYAKQLAILDPRKNQWAALQAAEAATADQRATQRLAVSVALNGLLESLCSVIEARSTSSADLLELCTHVTAGPVLQAIIATVAAAGAPGQSDTFLANVLQWQGEPGAWTYETAQTHFKALISDRQGSHLVEHIIQHASDLVLSSLFRGHFQGKLLSFAKEPIANFPFQKLLGRINDGEVLKECLSELKSSFADLFESKCSGVVCELVSAAGRLGVARKKMVKALAVSLGIDDTTPKAEFVDRLLRLATGQGRPEKKPKLQLPTGDDEDDSSTEKKKGEKVKAKSSVSLHGALLIQAVLAYPLENSKPIVDSMHAQSTESLVMMACDPTASRVVECMLTVPTIDDAGKRRFVDRFKGQFAHLGLQQFGSFFVEKAFNWVDIPTKKRIATELLADQLRLSKCRGGQALLRKCEVQLLKRTPREWEAKWTSSARKRELFSDILTPSSSSSSSSSAPAASSSDSKEQKKGSTKSSSSSSSGSSGKPVRAKRSSDDRDRRTVLATDEIDSLFNAHPAHATGASSSNSNGGTKRKPAAAATTASSSSSSSSSTKKQKRDPAPVVSE